MKKYNKSDIMKKAWKAYKEGQRRNGANKSFAECLKLEWSIAKRDVGIEAETVRYFNEVCVDVIKSGEDAVGDAFRAWRSGNGRKEDADSYRAHMRAWEAAVAAFRNVTPTFGTELVNSQIMAEIQDLDVA